MSGYNNDTFANGRNDSNQCVLFRDFLLEKLRFPSDPIDTLQAQIVFALLYVIVWLLAVFGNVVVIYVAVVERLSLTVRTVFIVSLAGSDLAIAFVSLPATAVSTFTHTWEFPNFTCHGIGFLQGASIFLSSFTLTAIAVDRYLLIVHPHHTFITYVVARNAVFVMFLLGVLLALPMAIFVNVMEIPQVCGVLCTEEWPLELDWLKTFYGLAVPTLQFGIPLIITTYCYYEIGRQMKVRYRMRQKQEHLLKKSERKESDRRRRANRMMAAMVVTFVAAWLPFNCLNMIRDFNLFQTFRLEPRYFNLLFATFHFLAMTSLIWNVFIYGFFHESFRTTITNLCRTRSQKRQVKTSRSTTNAMLTHSTTNNRNTSRRATSSSNKLIDNRSPASAACFDIKEIVGR